MNRKHRRRARKLAFQAVFMLDARQDWDVALVREFLGRADSSQIADVKEYALALTRSVIENREDLDVWLNQVNEKWQLKRMRAEDRALLRCGVAELWFHSDVPPNVAMNEWIEVAKVFSGDDSPRFVNGVLDRAAKDIPDRTA